MMGRTSCSKRTAISPTRRAARIAVTIATTWMVAITITPRAMRPR